MQMLMFFASRRVLLKFPRVRRRHCSSLSSAAKSGWSDASSKVFHESAKMGDGMPMEFRTGHMARFASGAVVLNYHDSALLSTVVSKQREGDPIMLSVSSASGLQLSVDFRQSAAAVGRIPSNYFRREMQMTDQDVIVSRIVDRSLRPSFFPNYGLMTQISCKPLAIDENGDLAVLGVNAASAALAVSPVPMRCTVGAVRIAIVDDNFVINPSTEQLKHAKMNLLLSGTGTDEYNRVFMIDMDGCEINADVFFEGVRRGMIEIGRVAAAIRRLASDVNRPKYSISCSTESELLNELLKVYDDFCRNRIDEIFHNHSHDKSSRDGAINEVRSEFMKICRASEEDERLRALDSGTLNAHFTAFTKDVLRRLTLKNKVRCDGRGFDEVRPIGAEVAAFPKLHGSAVFQRGQSQVFATVTFDSPQAAFHPDGIAQLLGAQRQKTFMLHYEFPQFAVNELSTGSGGVNRREIGHGMLAEKALKHVIPADFPYTIRVATQVLESNGSTSMAAACAGSLALYDAGVPLRGAVGGIAIGLFTKNNDCPLGKEEDEDAEPIFLVDLFGLEDFIGDMDFKMAGTSKGFTAMQMDLKICGLSQRQLRAALRFGRAGIDHVLSCMSKALATPRSEFKPTVPIMETWNLPSHYRRAILFKNGAYNAKLVESETGVRVIAEEENALLLLAPNKEKAEKAKEMIEKLLCDKNDVELDFGAFYKAQIVEVLENGVMAIVKKGTRPLLIRNADLSNRKIGHPSALKLKVGDEITVRYYGRDQNGFHRLTCKMITNPNIAIQNKLPRKRTEKDVVDAEILS